MKIEQASFTEILDAENAIELLAEYAAECSIPAIGPIKPNREMYKILELGGVMHCFTVRDDGELAGFANLLTSVIPHYSRKVATLESLFVSKKFRRMGWSVELMRKIEQFALDCGCVGIFYSAPAGGSLEMLLQAKKRYKRTNAIFYGSL